MYVPIRINDTEAKYYADGEDAYDMRKKLKSRPKGAADKAKKGKKVLALKDVDDAKAEEASKKKPHDPAAADTEVD